MSKESRATSVAVGMFVVSGLALTTGNVSCCPDGSLPPCTQDGETPVVLVDELFNDTPILRNFNPSAAGTLITATVEGDVTGSRIPVTITDVGTGNVVANEASPTTNRTTVTFLSTSSGVHLLRANQTAVGSSVYRVYITEQ